MVNKISINKKMQFVFPRDLYIFLDFLNFFQKLLPYIIVFKVYIFCYN